MPTLTQFWTDRVAAATAAEAGAATDLAAAQAALARPGGLRATHAAAGAALAAKAAEITAGRKALAEPGLSPAELAGRAAALQPLFIEYRRLRRAALVAEGELALGEGALTAAQAAHGERVAALQAARRELTAATARADRLARWHAALAAEPLTSVATRATAAEDANAQPFKPARQRIQGDVPTKLRNRAIERFDEELAHLDLVREAAAQADALLAGELEPVSGEAAAAAAALAAAERELGDYVAYADPRLTAAVATLQAIVASPPLTANETAAIADSDRVAKGEAALPKEKARDAKRKALAAKRAELDAKRIELLAADVDADLPADPDVQALEADLATLEGQLATAETAFTTQMQADLDDWEAAVPDAAWDRFLAFERTKRRLDGLAATDPADLEAAVATAETALVAALEADGKRRRTLDFLRGAAAGSHRRHDVTLAVQERRVVGAVRGDQ